MLRRRNSQKPSQEFLSDFKRQYCGVLPTQLNQSVLAESTSASASQTPNLAFDLSQFEGFTGRNNGQQFTSGSLDFSSEFKTSGLLDPNVDGFHEFTQPGGFWPPTPQGSAPFVSGPHQHLEQHNPFGIDTPISAGTHNLNFHQQASHFPGHEFIPPQRIHSFHEASQHLDVPSNSATQTFNPTVPSIGHVDPRPQGLRLSDINLSQGYEQPQPHPPSATRTRALPLDSIGPRAVVDAMNQFRFRTILKAQTAMIKHPQDVPITYLNKSQVYNIHVEDSMLGHAMADPSLQYRTAVRISFEDEQQRKNPASSWQLWNEGRGTNEAIKRGVKPKAVEFVSQDQSQIEHRSNLRPVTENFDGFSVVWSPNVDGMASCNIQLRFNFLSTDFSHSKGVKGVPVRLCAKTELIDGQHMFSPDSISREISYCAVKIFRDHGAERKLANDKAHIDKLIDKFTTQAEQAEVGAKESGKRRRSDSVVSSRPSKVARRRTWSVSSGSTDEQVEAAEDELAVRIRALRAMPESLRPVSAFYLRGEEQDDLDTHPVPPLAACSPSGSPVRNGPPTLKTDTSQTTSRSTGLGPEAPSSRSPSMLRLKAEPTHQLPPPSLSTTPSYQGKSPVKSDARRATPQQLASPPSSEPMKAQKPEVQATTTPSPRPAQALDVDRTYQPPHDHKIRAVAELFVKPSMSWKSPLDDNYRAIYLNERTLGELVRAIAAKCTVDPQDIICTVRVNAHGLPITAEDEMVEQIPERQDLIAELDVAENTHSSAAQFFESNDDGVGSSTKYKLTLRY